MGRRTSRARRRTSRNARRTSRGKQRRVTHKSVKRLIKLARQQGWGVEFTRKGHLQFIPPDKTQEIIVASGTPSDWRASKNLEAQLKKSGLRTNRRTSRGLRHNTIPPPPPWDPGSHRNAPRYLHWAYTTYADGTPVMFKVSKTGFSFGRPIDVHAGAKAIMSPWDSELPWDATVELIPGAYQYPDGGHVSIDMREEAIEDILEPLEDNWKVRAGRPISRHMLAASQRLRLKPNIAVGEISVPPPMTIPGKQGRHWRSWIKTVFAPGTPVKVKGLWLYDSYGRQRELVPKGARAVVVGDRPMEYGSGGDLSVEIEVVDARDEAGYPLPVTGARGWAFVDVGEDRWYGLEPLVDNWATKLQTRRRTSRHALPGSQRWVKPNIPIDRLRVPEPDRSQTSVRDYFSWLKMTFAPGTPVKILRSDEYLRRAPPGARAEVTRVKGIGNVWVRFTDARDEVGLPLVHIIGAEGVSHAPYYQLEPLTDNWLEAFRSRSTSRHRLPASQRSWMKPNPSVSVGDVLELERHPVYEHHGYVPSYKSVRKRVTSVHPLDDGRTILQFAGSERQLVLDRGGEWLTSYDRRPLRYLVMAIIKR